MKERRRGRGWPISVKRETFLSVIGKATWEQYWLLQDWDSSFLACIYTLQGNSDMSPNSRYNRNWKEIHGHFKPWFTSMRSTLGHANTFVISLAHVGNLWRNWWALDSCSLAMHCSLFWFCLRFEWSRQVSGWTQHFLCLEFKYEKLADLNCLDHCGLLLLPTFFFSFACLNALTRILECTFYFLPIGYSTAACASLADMSMLLSLMTQNTHCPFCQWLLCVSYIAEEWADQRGKGIRWPIKLPCSI